MVSDSSGEESVFGDCASSGTERAPGDSRRRQPGPGRQQSMSEMLQQLGSRKEKRRAPGRGSRSPPDAAPPAAKRAAAASGAGPPPVTAAAPAAVELSEGALAAIKDLINAGNARVISAIDAKLDILERRVNILESEVMDKDLEIRSLRERLERQERVNDDLKEQVEGIDANRRLSSIILTCDDFTPRSPNENIEEMVSQVINNRFPQINMTAADIQAAHRLQGKNKVIVRFIKRRLRDTVYDSRFELMGGAASRGRRMAPLYITESLTPSNRLIYMALLDARRPENGGKVASVFTRRGQVLCRVERGGANIRVPDWEHLQRLLDGSPRGSPPAGRPGAPPGRGEAPATSRPAGPGGGPPPAPARRTSAEPPPERRPPLLPTPDGAVPSAPPTGQRMDVVPPETAPSTPAPATSASATSQQMDVAPLRTAPPPPAPPADPPGSGPLALLDAGAAAGRE